MSSDLMKRLNRLQPEEASELTVIFEEEEIYTTDITWSVPKCKIESLKSAGKSIKSEYFYIDPSSNICAYFLLYPQGKDISVNQFVSLYVVFYYELPKNSWTEGTLSFVGKKGDVFKSENFSIKGNSSMKAGFNSFDKAKNLGDYVIDEKLNIQCFIKMKVRAVKCECDNREFSVLKSMEYDSFEETLYKNNFFSDVKFSFGENDVQAHKALLAINIPAFKKLFYSADPSMQEFKLQGMKRYIIVHMLCFLYTRKVPLLDFKLACELYLAANDYEFDSLQNICSSYLGANLTERNVFIVVALAEKCKDKPLKKWCIEFIKQCNSEMLTNESIIPIT